MDKTLETLEKYILYATLVLVPLIVLPIFPNSIDTPKIIVLSAGVVAALTVRTIRMIVKGKLELTLTKYDMAVLLIAVSYILSTVLRTPNKMEGLWLPGTTTIIVASALFYFLANQLKEKDKKVIGLLLFATGVLVAFSSLLGVTGILAKIPSLPVIFQQSSFTTVGGNLPAAIFLAVVIPVGLGLIMEAKDAMQKTFYTLALAIATLGLFANIYNLLPGKPTSPRFVSFADSWSIAVDTLKSSPFLGAGPGNYITAFNIYRPISFNQTDLWQVKFTQGRDFFLTNLTETGLFGLLGFAVLFYMIYKVLQKDFKERKLMAESKKTITVQQIKLDL